jgi:general secretion pathway protein A
MKTLDPSPPNSSLQGRPFAANTDPRVLWPGRAYQQALGGLVDGTLRNAGFMLLTGQAGTGKTMLVNALTDRLGDAVVVARLAYPALEVPDFYRFLARAFGIEGDPPTRAAFLERLATFLDVAAAKEKRVLVAIDDAQSLTPTLFEEIRALADLATDRTVPINILLVGGDELAALIERNDGQLAERIQIRCRLDPLREDETEAYIRHRLKLAGSDEQLFTSEAAREISSAAGGIPGLINIICDLALLSLQTQGGGPVGPQLAMECAAAFKLETAKGDPSLQPAPPRPAQRSRGNAVLEPPAGRAPPAPRASRRLRAVLVAVSVLLIALVAGLAVHLIGPTRQDQSLRGPPSPETRATSIEKGPEEPAGIHQAPAPAPGSPLEGTTTRRAGRDAPPGAAPAKTPAKGVRAEPGPQEETRRRQAERTPAPGAEEAAGTRLPGTANVPAGESLEEDPDSPDPAGVIDWLLREHAAKRE